MFRIGRTLPFALALSILSIFTAGCGSSNSKLRLVHAVPDGGVIDVLIDGKNVAPGLSFDTATSYLSMASGSRHVQVFAAGTTTNAFFDGTVNLSGGTTYTAVATGFANRTPPVNNTVVAPVFTDDNSAPTSGNAKLRFIHASPSGPTPVDIYVVAPETTDISGVSPSISSVAYTNASTYLSVPAGTFKILVTPAGLKAVDITVPSASFTAGQIRTFIAVDVQNGGSMSGTPLELSDLN